MLGSARNGRQAAESIRMQCPFCKTKDARVVDSRETDGGAAIRRRRQCAQCHRRFTTYERAQTSVRVTVVKKDGSRVPYDRSKILTGLEKACYKRPVSAEKLEQLIDQVEEELLGRHEREIAAAEIGRALSERLKGLDQVAYVRFASVYKQFRDLDDFLDEVRDVLESAPPDSPQQGKLF